MSAPSKGGAPSHCAVDRPLALDAIIDVLPRLDALGMARTLAPASRGSDLARIQRVTTETGFVALPKLLPMTFGNIAFAHLVLALAIAA